MRAVCSRTVALAIWGAALTAPVPVQRWRDARGALRKSGPTPRNPRARQAGRRSYGRTPAASRSRWQCRANNRHGILRHKRDTPIANRSSETFLPSAESRTGCDMRSAFRRGWEGEGKLNRRPGAGQRARSDRHSGAAILLWEREGKALGVPAQSGRRSRQAPALADNGISRFPHPQRGTNNGTLARRDADGRPAAASKFLPVVARQRSPGTGT